MTRTVQTQGTVNNGALVDEFLTWCELTRLRPDGTIRNYASVLGAWVRWLDSTPIEHALPRDVETFARRTRQRGRGPQRAPKPATVAKDVAILASFYKWGLASGAVGSNPTTLAGRPTVHNLQPRPVPDDLWAAVWSHPQLGDVDRVWLGLGFYAGLRRHELTALRPTNLVEGKLVAFRRKGGGEDTLDVREMALTVAERLPALLPAPERFFAPLAALAATERPWLLPWAETAAGGLHPQQVTRRLRKVLAQLGMTENLFTPHALRHSACTNLIRSGVPLPLVSALLNHSDPKVTMRYLKLGGSALGEWRKGQGGGW